MSLRLLSSLCFLLGTLAYAEEDLPTYEQPVQLAYSGSTTSLPYKPEPGTTIALVGGGLGERLQYYGFLEAEVQSRFPESNIRLRNLCNSGFTAGLRPHASRVSQWAFPGADVYHPDFQAHRGEGHFPTPDEWLTIVKADLVVGFFGYSESFMGKEGLENFKNEIRAWIDHTRTQGYNGESAPDIVLVTPIAFEDRSTTDHLPNGRAENARLQAYANALLAVSREKKVGAIDVFKPSQNWFRNAKSYLTVNGCHLNEEGYRRFSTYLAEKLMGKTKPHKANSEALADAIAEKNWMWDNDYRMVNGVHAYGRRWKPFGDFNYPEEIEKIRQMTDLRDEVIWAAAQGKETLPVPNDSSTRKLTPVISNFGREISYLEEEAAILSTFTTPDDFEVGLFASEVTFPDLANPVQCSFDNRGRLWVAVMPSYPHYKPGGVRPNDKLIILEDTDGDGRADKQETFADGLHLPIGFQIQPDGSVIVSQQPRLIRLRDTDGDGKADSREILLTGFDSHDTHHAIGAFTSDPSGAIYMLEGIFLHSQVETPYGTERGVDAHVWRFDPVSWRLEKFSAGYYWNPWGIAFDQWGQTFLSDASDGRNYWLTPMSGKVPHGEQHPKQEQFTTQRVRPTSGSEFVYNSHFPAEQQGDFLLCNSIGFLGVKQHTIENDGSGFTGELRQDLLSSNDPNFRPVDLETAPDGTLYVVDWQNALVGHMQHSARDPNRDKIHGRIFRIKHKERPLVDPPQVAGASVQSLLENLELPEYRARFRSHRELRGRSASKVMPALNDWVSSFDSSNPVLPRLLLEALWVSWGQRQVDVDLLRRCLTHGLPEVRAAAVRVLRYVRHDLDLDIQPLLLQAARDPHPRVRMEAMAFASWLDNEAGAEALVEGAKYSVDKYMGYGVEAVFKTLVDDIENAEMDLTDNPKVTAYLNGDYRFVEEEVDIEAMPITNMTADELKFYELGKEVYHRDAHCMTCHQADGKGLGDTYPGLLNNEWVTGNNERLIKIVLKGLWGPIEVAGKTFDPSKGVPPMTGFEGILNNEEIAGVLTYVRSAFGNRGGGGPISPEEVARVRGSASGKTGYYLVEDLLKEHPFTKEEAFVED